MDLLRRSEIFIFFIIFGLIFFFTQPDKGNKYELQGDGYRYMSYALSLHHHGVFGLSDPDLSKIPESSNANAPIYPALIAAVMSFDQDFADSLSCIRAQGLDAECSYNFENFFMLQMAFSVLSLYLIYLLAVRFSGRKKIGWLAAFVSMICGVFQELSFMLSTELLIVPAFSLLSLFCLSFYQNNSLKSLIAIGFILAVMTLIRPSYLYLFYGFILFFVVLWGIKRDRHHFLRLLALCIAFLVGVLPWALRNKAHFDSYTLTSGGYAEAILVQRTNYNQMRWAEIGVAIIYWLPDFGDSLARQLFPEDLYKKLGWGPDSYYNQGYTKQIKSLSEQLGGKEKILGYLVKEEVLTPKHVAVSIPLALRGVYVSKYWGLLGLIGFLILLCQTLRRRDYSLAVLSLPVFFMVAFHAGISVSIPRYNLPLIMLYALSLAWYINHYGHRIFDKFRQA